MERAINTLRPGQNGLHFADDIFKCIFLNWNVWIPIIISLKFVPKSPINNIPALVQKMAWRRPGDKPLSDPMMFRLPTHICVTRPQWVLSSPMLHWAGPLRYWQAVSILRHHNDCKYPGVYNIGHRATSISNNDKHHSSSTAKNW